MPTLDDAPEQPPRRPSRMEQEIAEILERTEQPVSLSEHVRRKATPTSRVHPSRMDWTRQLRQFGPGTYLLGALAFALLGALVSGGSPLLAMLFSLVSVGSFVMVWIRRTPPGIGQPKMWRGRSLDPGPNPSQWLDDLRDRFQGPPNRR